jgi:molybdopterin converting factor subunit 1
MTTVTVRLFARTRDLAGADFLAVDLPGGATVADVRRALAERVPALGALLPRCAVAVNEEFAGDDLAVPRDADVALLPPVSGG